MASVSRARIITRRRYSESAIPGNFDFFQGRGTPHKYSLQYAKLITSFRLVQPVFRIIFSRCLLIVNTLSLSVDAISLVVFPWTINSNISFSRAVNTDLEPGVALSSRL